MDAAAVVGRGRREIKRPKRGDDDMSTGAKWKGQEDADKDAGLALIPQVKTLQDLPPLQPFYITKLVNDAASKAVPLKKRGKAGGSEGAAALEPTLEEARKTLMAGLRVEDRRIYTITAEKTDGKDKKRGAPALKSPVGGAKKDPDPCLVKSQHFFLRPGVAVDALQVSNAILRVPISSR
jgi:hypothetical protein